MKGLICEELRDSIDIQVTWYHQAHDGVGEAYITVHKEKVYGCGHYAWLKNASDISLEQFYEVYVCDENILREMSLWNCDTTYITTNIYTYLQTPFETLLTSNNPIYRAFMLVDRRLWKRRFESIVLQENESDLVKIFYTLRKEVFNKK